MISSNSNLIPQIRRPFVKNKQKEKKKGKQWTDARTSFFIEQEEASVKGNHSLK